MAVRVGLDRPLPTPRSRPGWPVAARMALDRPLTTLRAGRDVEVASGRSRGTARNYGVAMSTEWPWADEFEPDGTYLNSATMGLPPRGPLAAMATAMDEWRRGTAFAPGYDADVAAARAAYARLVGVGADTVAIGSQVSPLVALVAAAVPDGATVLVPEGEFTSVTFPFLAQEARGIRVVEAPLAEIAEHVDGSTGLVALSAAQSSDGSLAPLDALEAAAARHGVDVLLDVTQAAGWLPVDAGRFAYTVCAAYKWLLSPRGTAFLTVRRDRWTPSFPPPRAGTPVSSPGRRSTGPRSGSPPTRGGTTSRRGGTPGWARHPRWPCSSGSGWRRCTRTRSRPRRPSRRRPGWSRRGGRSGRWPPTPRCPGCSTGTASSRPSGPAGCGSPST